MYIYEEVLFRFETENPAIVRRHLITGLKICFSGTGTVFVGSSRNSCGIGFVLGGVMSGLVIPIKELSPPELAAVRFALEYGKRSQARLFFLFVDDPELNQSGPVGKKQGECSVDRGSTRKAIESLIAREQALGELNLEVHHRRGDFIQEVRQFIRDSHADEIVMPVSEELAPVHRPIQQEIQILAQMTHCRILTVKPKPICEGPAHLDH